MFPAAIPRYFLILNANKRSVTADLKSEKGRALVRKLIAKSDVFIENFGPGTIERLGFDYESVKKINPAIIYAQIKGFASDGPFREGAVFRHGGAGGGRVDVADGRSAGAADDGGGASRRYRGGAAWGDRHSGGAASAGAHGARGSVWKWRCRGR